MQQNNQSEKKNIMVIGKVGEGKSYFLNLLLQQTPPTSPFAVFDSLDLRRYICQVEHKTIDFGLNETLNLNILDTPGLFEEYIQGNNQQISEHDPIEKFKNFEITVQQQPFQKRMSRVLLVIKVDNKFDEHIKKMIKITKILLGEQRKVCVILSKCQNEYDEDEDGENYIINKLKQKEKEWKARFAEYGIEDQIDYTQWYELYKNLQRSILTPIKTWDDLTIIQKARLANYFGYELDLSRGCLSLNCNIGGLVKPNLLGMIHFSNHKVCKFLRITYKYKNQVQFIELTGNHLIYCSNKKQFIRADLLNLDDYLFLESYEEVQIEDIQPVIDVGYFAPLTSTGEFFSNGVLVSCYVSPDSFPVSQKIAHLAMMPLIFYRQLTLKKQVKPNIQDYKAPYCKFLEWIFQI